MHFWEQKTLSEMTPGEWESLCDGCGRCCLHKIEDADSGKVYTTRIACELLDIDSCRCRDYKGRFDKVPDCMALQQDLYQAIQWLPQSCAYRLLAEGKSLPDWHPLVSGDPGTVFEAGISVRHLARHADQDTELEDEIIDEI